MPLKDADTVAHIVETQILVYTGCPDLSGRIIWVITVTFSLTGCRGSREELAFTGRYLYSGKFPMFDRKKTFSPNIVFNPGPALSLQTTFPCLLCSPILIPFLNSCVAGLY